MEDAKGAGMEPATSISAQGEDTPLVKQSATGTIRQPTPEVEEIEVAISPIEQRLFGWSLRFILTVAGLVVAYWFLSGGLTLFNKWFFSIRGFRFPILVVMGTFLVHFLFMAMLRTLSGYFPNSGVFPTKQVANSGVYWKFLVPIGICTALEIASSNLALTKLSVSFHTMVHASKPIFIAGWSVAIGLQPPSIKLSLIVCLVTIGVMMLSFGESGAHAARSMHSSNVTVSGLDSTSEKQTMNGSNRASFSLEGLLLILFSCFVSGARWSLVQLMLQRINLSDSASGAANKPGSRRTLNRERMTPTNLIFYAAPVSGLTLIPFFLFLEMSRLGQYVSAEPDATGDLFGFQAVVTIWSLTLNLVEFYFVKTTSGLVLSFAAISKEMLLVLISVLVSGDELPPLNIVGFVLCIVGIVLYNHEHTAHPHPAHGQSQSYSSIQPAVPQPNASIVDKRESLNLA